MLSAPTVDELATFSGRPAGSYGGFATEALAQATLLFSLVTKLGDYPADPDLTKLAKNAIMQMADRLVLEQPYQAMTASPFSSENLGGYSYSKSATFKTARDGGDTGLVWWELAVDELSQVDRSIVASASYSVFDRDEAIVHVEGGGGFITGPGDPRELDAPYWVNAETPRG